MHRHCPLLPFVVLAPLAGAQTTISLTITDNNMVFRQGPLPAATSNGWGSADLRASGPTSTDNLFSLWWYYRVAGDSQEYSFRNDAAPGTPTRVASGNQIVTTWPNVANRGLFDAILFETVVSTGPDRGFVVATMVIGNLTPNSLTIDLFSLSDLDVGGSSSGYLTNVSWGNIRSQYTEQQNTALPGLEFYCPDADAVQVDPYLTTTPGRLPFLLTNTTIDDLAGWNGTFGPGDHNGAFQWHRTLLPSGSLSFTVYVAMTSQRPLQSIYGTAGAGSAGLPTIGTSERAIVDPTASTPRSFDVQLGNAVPFAAAFLLMNFGAAALTVQGLQVWVDPIGAATQFRLTNGAGTAAVTIPLPPIASLNGLPLHDQWFVLDAGGVGGLAAYTHGLAQTIGSW
jgi:hypothetical protein